MDSGGQPRGYRASHLDKGLDYDRQLSRRAFDRYMTSCEADVLRRIIPRLLDGIVPTYLDFACGTGRITKIVRPLVGTAFGADVSASMVEAARSSVPSASFHVVDLTRDPSPIPQVDLVTAFRFFGNAEDELRHEALRVIHTQLRGGGYLILNAHRNPIAISNLLKQVRGKEVVENLTHSKMRRLLRAHGFSVCKIIGIAGWVIRGRYATNAVLETRTATVLERISRILVPARFCPDAVFVAQKLLNSVSSR